MMTSLIYRLNLPEFLDSCEMSEGGAWSPGTSSFFSAVNVSKKDFPSESLLDSPPPSTKNLLRFLVLGANLHGGKTRSSQLSPTEILLKSLKP